MPYDVRTVSDKIVFFDKDDEKVMGILDKAKIIEGVIYDPINIKYDAVSKLICIRGGEEKSFLVGNKLEQTEFLKFVYTKNKLPLKFYAENPNSPEAYIDNFIDTGKRAALGDVVEYEKGKAFTTLFAPYIYLNPKKNKMDLFIPNPLWDLQLDHEDKELKEMMDRILEKVKKKVRKKLTKEELRKELDLIMSLSKNNLGLSKIFTIWSWTISSFYRLLLWDLGVRLIPILVNIGEKSEGKSTLTRCIIANSIGTSYDDRDILYGEGDLGGTGIRLKGFGVSTLPFIFDDVKKLRDFSSMIKDTATQRIPKMRRGKRNRGLIEYPLPSPYTITTNKLDVEEPSIYDRMIVLPTNKGDLTEEKVFRKMNSEELEVLTNNNVLSIIFWKAIPNKLREGVEREGIGFLEKLTKIEGADLRTKDKLRFLKFGFELLKDVLSPVAGNINWENLWDTIRGSIENPSKDYIIESETARIVNAFVNYLREVDFKDRESTLEKISRCEALGLNGDLPEHMEKTFELEEKGIKIDIIDTTQQPSSSIQKVMVMKVIFFGKTLLAGLYKQGSGHISGLRELTNALREQGMKCKYCYSYKEKGDSSFSIFHNLIRDGNNLKIVKEQKTNCIEIDKVVFDSWLEGVSV